MIPCILFEDEHLVVIKKPAGINTHRPSPYTTDGIYDWLKNQNPRYYNLSTLHRLDKETSGILIFGKTPEANRSLTNQFAKRKIQKSYYFLTDRPINFSQRIIRSDILRQGNRYITTPLSSQLNTLSQKHSNTYAETHFKVLEQKNEYSLIEAIPVTGRTHQIRIHASWGKFPILGDQLYQGTPIGGYICLHAVKLLLYHPITHEKLLFESPSPFTLQSIPGLISSATTLRTSLLSENQTNAYRLFHSQSDGFENIYIDKFNKHLLISGLSQKLSPEIKKLALTAGKQLKSNTVWYRPLLKTPGKESNETASPTLIWSKEPNPTPEVEIKENGIKYKISFQSGYSVGIFLDQRENRQRILTRRIAPNFSLPYISNRTPEMLNAFAYTCAFSICAAKAGYHTTSLDLSKKYLSWGAENMALNNIEPQEHDFIYGDVFNWRKRFLNKGKKFDLIILDPPTFSRSRESGTFKAEQDIGKLAASWIPLLNSQGVMLISTNCAQLPPKDFEEILLSEIKQSGRKLLKSHYYTQPFDFAASSQCKPYLKTYWIQLN